MVDLRWWGKGKRCGVEVDQRVAFLYTFRSADNKIVRSQLFDGVGRHEQLMKRRLNLGL